MGGTTCMAQRLQPGEFAAIYTEVEKAFEGLEVVSSLADRLYNLYLLTREEVDNIKVYFGRERNTTEYPSSRSRPC